MEIICGINAVYETLKAKKRKAHTLFIAEGKKDNTILKLVELAEKSGLKVKTVQRSKIFELSHVETNQGVALEVEPVQYLSIEELINISKKRGKAPFIVILDQINDPHNLGAIIRTAHLVGADGIVIPKDNSADVTPTVTKASSGAVEYLPIAKVVNLNAAINTLKNNNIWVVGAEGGGNKTIYDYDFDSAVAIVLGGEGKGLRRLVKEHCDELLKIPMFGNID